MHMDSAANPNTAIQSLPLKELRLRAGMSMQFNRKNNDNSKIEAQFLAAIPGKSIMVGPNGAHDWIATLVAGEECVLSGFTGQYDFVFSTQVLQTFAEPFHYVLLAYPPAVSARLVRRALRMKTSIPSTAVRLGDDNPINATLIDLSTAGGLVSCPESLGAVGDKVALAFSSEFEGQVLEMSFVASIRHTSKVEASNSYNVGLFFNDISQENKLALHYLVQAVAAQA